LNVLLKHINNFRKLGVSKKTSDSERLKIEVVNDIVLVCMIGWFANNTYNLFCGDYRDIAVAIPLLLSCLIPLILNACGKSKTARLAMIFLISISISGLYFVSGPPAFYEIAFLLLMVLVFYLFDNLILKSAIAGLVLLFWFVPFYYTAHNPSIFPSQNINGVVEVIFVACMLGLYVVTKKIVDQSNAYVRNLNENIKIQKQNLLLVEQQNHELELQTERLKGKKQEIEMFFEMSSEYLKKPTIELVKLSKSLEQDIPSDLPLVKDVFSIINQSSYRMGKLIESVFDYSNISENSPKTDVDCREILCEIEIDLFNELKRTRTLLHFDNLPTVYGNRTEIRMLFQNLITNAIKYSKAGIIPVISISAEKKEACWKISIEDNGIGIDKNFQSKVFEMFQKLHNNKEIPGTGIGLAHCKKIISHHKGEIWVDSEVGVGSTFYFTLATKDQYENIFKKAPVLV